MSMKLMVEAMNTKVGNPLRKLVLIKLADNANDSGECWPSYQHIADQCEISARSVIRHIDALCEAGLLQKQHRPGPKGNRSNLYRVTLRGDTVSLGVVTESHKGGDTVSLGGSDRESPRTSHSFESVIESSSGKPQGGDGGQKQKPEKAKKPPCPYDEIKTLYHEILPEFPEVRLWSPKRKSQVKALWGYSENTCRIDWWREYFEFVRGQKFLMQAAIEKKRWCDIEFLTNPNKFPKIIEGAYQEASHEH